MNSSRAHRTVLLTHALLLALVVVWQLTVREGTNALWIALATAIPLALPWPGLVKGNRRTHAWGSLCVMPYLVMGSVEAVANPDQRLWSTGCVALALLFFAALIHYLRVTRPVPAP